jgi:hypothetical protein
MAAKNGGKHAPPHHDDDARDRVTATASVVPGTTV